MGQNSDIHNIFESYSDRVLFKEQQSGVYNIPALEAKLKTIGSEKDRKTLENQIAELKKAQTSSNNATPQPAAPQQAPVAPTKTDPKAEYNKKLGRIPGDYDPDSFENVDRPMNSQNRNLDKARKIKQGIVAGNNAAPQMPSTPTGNSGGGISVGGLTIPATKPSAPNSGGAVTAQMPTDPQGSSASNIDVKIPADLGGGGTAPASEKTPLQVGGGISIGNPDAAQKTPAKTTEGGSNKKQPSSSGGSIVDYLAGKNQEFDKASRAKLAARYGIQNYTGTAQQNTDLLNKLKADEKMPQGTNATGEKQYATGTVPKAPANEPQQQPQQQQDLGGLAGLASKGIGAGGNIIKKGLVGDRELGGLAGLASKGIGAGGNLIKKALIGGGQQQSAPTQQAPVQQQTAPVKKSPTKQQAPAKKTTGLAADKYVEDEEIQENRNIAKFVKCLSEKNYSQAHEYLKKVLNAKVEKNLHKVVNKI